MIGREGCGLPGQRWPGKAQLVVLLARESPTAGVTEPAAGGRTQVIYRTEITGPAGPQLGPAITADFPEVLAALVKLAGG